MVPRGLPGAVARGRREDGDLVVVADLLREQVDDMAAEVTPLPIAA